MEHYPDLVGEVVRSEPDLIFTQTSHLVRRFKAATTTIPIVAYMSDPVAEKLVLSLAHPGGNITGLVTDPGPTFYEKMLEILGEALGRKLSRVGMLTSEQRWGEAAMYSAYRTAARRVGIDFVAGVLTGYEERHYRPAFDRLKEERAEALIVGTEAENYARRVVIVRLANEYGTPAIYPDRIFVESGGLISYGFDIPVAYRRAARIMDTILKGTNPGEIPMEQPTKFELAVNLKTAGALGVTLPTTLVSRADLVIE